MKEVAFTDKAMPTVEFTIGLSDFFKHRFNQPELYSDVGFP